MKNFGKKLMEYWYLIIIIGLLLAEAFVFLGLGDESYIAVHDNLDLFIPHLRMLKTSGTFFTQGDVLPVLGGVTRDNFGSEFSLYNLLYLLLPTYYAYIAGYFLSIGIAMGSVWLLAKECLKDFAEYKPLVLLFGLIYGILPVFPTYGFAFASIPLVVFLLVKLYKKADWRFFPALFFYPAVSYFSYFGFFILGYLVVFTIFDWIYHKKCNKGLLLSVPVLALGYVVLEYRLFRSMLFDDTVTIRSSMVMASLNFKELLSMIKDGFVNSTFHAGDSHTAFVLPLVLLFFVIQNILFIKRKEYKKIFTDIFNLLFYFVLFNSLIYGLYYFEPLRSLVETLVPPLKGFQFYRTLFFNPFLWYTLLFILVKRLYDLRNIWGKRLADTIAFIALAVVVFTPAMYNDFYHTCYYTAYKLVKHTDVDMLNYHEFYSEELFSDIKEAIGYDGEYSAAYGFHPGVLTYNGISTLDGYLGLYPEEYKQDFRKIIAPALERSASFQSYFDTWGARAYIFPGFDNNSYLPSRNLTLPDDSLYIDTESFKALNGVYLFSRFEIGNAAQLNLTCLGSFTEETSPYTIYVYRAG